MSNVSKSTFGDAKHTEHRGMCVSVCVYMYYFSLFACTLVFTVVTVLRKKKKRKKSDNYKLPAAFKNNI